jgi:hypothetical protein
LHTYYLRLLLLFFFWFFPIENNLHKGEYLWSLLLYCIYHSYWMNKWMSVIW